MDYHTWIERERRLRIRLLMQSPDIKQSGLFRVCATCSEVCLCHEESCPHCGQGPIEERPLDRDEVKEGKMIRCRLRYAHLFYHAAAKGGEDGS